MALKTSFLAVACLFLIQIRFAHSVEILGDREVKYIETPQNWATAYEMCRAQGMQLLTIKDKEEYDQMITIAAKYKPRPSYWLAANDIGHEGTFVWATNGQPVPNLWATGQPDNMGGNENCLEFTYRWSETVPVWNDIPCHQQYPYFCEGTQPLVKSCNSDPPPVNFCTSVYRC